MDEFLNNTVQFQVRDVIHPRPTEVLMELFRTLTLEGQVVAETTDGESDFLVVRVKGLKEALIIPLARIAPSRPLSPAISAG